MIYRLEILTVVAMAMLASAAPLLAETSAQADAVQASPDADTTNRWATARYPGVRIFVDSLGAVFVDSQAATPALLHEAFTGLTGYSGVVWYYRENPSQDATGEVARAIDQVISILAGYKLAVELFEDGFPDPDEHRETLKAAPLD